MKTPLGSRSLLFGVHCWLVHPFYVAKAWKELYGPVKDYRIWTSFLVHDWGYWGKSNMDGPEGEEHVKLGAELMHKWFDGPQEKITVADRYLRAISVFGEILPEGAQVLVGKSNYRITGYSRDLYGRRLIHMEVGSSKWYDFCLYHSRHYAKAHNKSFSKLCVADKYAFCLEPAWFYLPRAILSGELHEYLEKANGKLPGYHAGRKNGWVKYIEWHKALKDYMYKWVMENKDKV